MKGTSVSKRAGWSLLELLMVIPILALLLSASAMLLTAVFRSQESLTSDIQQQASRARLAVQIRNDAHAAASARCDTPLTCDLALDDAVMIHYELKESNLHRELHRGDVVQEREVFPLAGLRGELSLDKTSGLPLLRLRLISTPEPQKYAAVARASVLEAAVGGARGRNRMEGSKP